MAATTAALAGALDDAAADVAALAAAAAAAVGEERARGEAAAAALAAEMGALEAARARWRDDVRPAELAAAPRRALAAGLEAAMADAQREAARATREREMLAELAHELTAALGGSRARVEAAEARERAFAKRTVVIRDHAGTQTSTEPGTRALLEASASVLSIIGMGLMQTNMRRAGGGFAERSARVSDFVRYAEAYLSRRRPRAPPARAAIDAELDPLARSQPEPVAPPPRPRALPPDGFEGVSEEEVEALLLTLLGEEHQAWGGEEAPIADAELRRVLRVVIHARRAARSDALGPPPPSELLVAARVPDASAFGTPLGEQLARVEALIGTIGSVDRAFLKGLGGGANHAPRGSPPRRSRSRALDSAALQLGLVGGLDAFGGSPPRRSQSRTRPRSAGARSRMSGAGSKSSSTTASANNSPRLEASALRRPRPLSAASRAASGAGSGAPGLDPNMRSDGYSFNGRYGGR